MSIHNDILKVFFPQKGTFYIGKSTPGNLANIVKYFPAGLSIEELLPIMLGTYPSPHKKNASLKGSWEEQRYRVDMADEDGIRLQSIWIDAPTQTLVKVQVFNKTGRSLYTASFEDYNKSPDDVDMPFKITITSEEAGHPELIIRYASVQFVPDVEDSAFNLQIPSGIEPIYLDGQEGN